MPKIGRPRLTPEDLQARIDAYCQRYRVKPRADGLPPFPAGKRETPQHREWILVYKAHHRLVRRERGQCERCSAPASEGSVFCETHRAGDALRQEASSADRRRLLKAQNGRCTVCADEVDPVDSLVHRDAEGRLRAVLHRSCHQLVSLVEARGRASFDRLRAYLWPKT